MENTKSRQPRTSYEDISAMCDFFEGNHTYLDLFCGNNQAVTHGMDTKSLNKTAVYSALAKYMNQHNTSKFHWDTKIAKNRFEVVYSKYKEAKHWHEKNVEEKCGISEEQLANGYTLEDILEKKCSHYFRLDKMFGERQNVKRSSVMEPSRPGIESSLTPSLESLISKSVHESAYSEDSSSCTGSEIIMDEISSSDEEEVFETRKRKKMSVSSTRVPEGITSIKQFHNKSSKFPPQLALNNKIKQACQDEAGSEHTTTTSASKSFSDEYVAVQKEYIQFKKELAIQEQAFKEKIHEDNITLQRQQFEFQKAFEAQQFEFQKAREAQQVELQKEQRLHEQTMKMKCQKHELMMALIAQRPGISVSKLKEFLNEIL